MWYLIAIILPPIAVIWAGKGFGGFIFNIILCFLGVIPGLIHALLVVKKRYAELKGGEVTEEKQPNISETPTVPISSPSTESAETTGTAETTETTTISSEITNKDEAQTGNGSSDEIDASEARRIRRRRSVWFLVK